MVLVVAAAALALPKPAGAQAEASAENEENPGSTPADGNEPEAGEGEAGNAPAAPASDEMKDQAGAAEPATSTGSGYLLGLRYRGIYIPQTAVNWFVDGGDSVYVSGFGPEFSIRDGDVEYILSAWVALYDMSPVAIKGSNDEELAWEIVESDITALYLTADYHWHARLANQLELSYGGGAGLGLLLGDLYRTQATLRPGGAPGNPDDFVVCPARNSNDPYCDDVNDHYEGYSEPSWFSGGSKPVIFPWLTGQVGLRYQPHEKLVTRLDVGLGTSGLFFGIGADYSL
jgi:hypothetical protein